MADMPVQHSPEYKFRRFLNWFPLGLSYALLYMGRYNLTVSKSALGSLMPNEVFGLIFGVGAWVYALAFLINGPLTDRIGGRKGMLIGMAGAVGANLLMGLYLWHAMSTPNPDPFMIKWVFVLLYAVNMYFQAYGAVAIVKVNSSWFHIRERGIFSAIFGIMISSGLFLAYDVNSRLLASPLSKGKGFNGGDAVWIVFLAPAVLLAIFWLIEVFILRDKPSQAGHADFETGDAVLGKDGEDIPALELIKRVLSHPVIITIACVEFCTGVLRNGIMNWYYIFAKEQLKDGHLKGWEYMVNNWGLILMIAGIVGGVFAGAISDKFFQSRRAPTAGFLYLMTFVCTLLMIPYLNSGWVLGFLVFMMSIGVIGTHGLLSGTATMDFGGRKGAATAVGVIDGFVYLGTGLQALAIGHITSSPKLGWDYWPVFLAPFGLLGFFLLRRIWDAKPQARTEEVVVDPPEKD